MTKKVKESLLQIATNYDVTCTNCNRTFDNLYHHGNVIVFSCDECGKKLIMMRSVLEAYICERDAAEKRRDEVVGAMKEGIGKIYPGEMAWEEVRRNNYVFSVGAKRLSIIINRMISLEDITLVLKALQMEEKRVTK